MSVQQFYIELTFNRLEVTDYGDEYWSTTHLSIDLGYGDVQEFLARIPDNIGERSSIRVVIKRGDGEELSYVDGVAYDPLPEGTKSPVSIREMDRAGVDVLHEQVRLFAGRKRERRTS